jgi:predicted amidohydrolase
MGGSGTRPPLEAALQQWHQAEERFDGTGVDVVVACEAMAAVGQSASDAEDVGRPGPILSAYMDTARRNHCTVVGSAKIAEADAVYNAQVVVGPNGTVLGRYRKTFITAGEAAAGFAPGPGAEVVETPAGRIGGVICFDLNFTELRAAYHRLAPDLIAFSSMYHGGHVQQSWAYETRAFFVAACKDVLSEIRDPFGRVLAAATAYSQVAIARVNLDRLVVHLDGNQELFAEIRRRYRDGVRIEAAPDLGVALISCEAEELSSADLLRAFPLIPLDPYLDAASASAGDCLNRRSRARRPSCGPSHPPPPTGAVGVDGHVRHTHGSCTQYGT